MMFDGNRLYYILGGIAGGLAVILIIVLVGLTAARTSERDQAVAKSNEYAAKAVEYSKQLQETSVQLARTKESVNTLVQQVRELKTELENNKRPVLASSVKTPPPVAASVEPTSQATGKRCPNGVDKSPEMNAERKKAVDKLTATGIFKSHRLSTASSDMAYAYVTPVFMSLDFDDKVAFTGVIYAHYFDGCSEGDSVMLKSSITNETVGDFSTKWGLHLR